MIPRRGGADGCDVKKGLKESAKLEWNGDVDLYETVWQHLKGAETICLEDLTHVVQENSKDLEFLQYVLIFMFYIAEIVKFNNKYSEKQEVFNQFGMEG